ncbi:hypothetical protein HDU93_004838 [Gonapodya sp. JEL0774]|nr:hypothetical protein HDU93_004838 [Gonapodya sp. JEL0774]
MQGVSTTSFINKKVIALPLRKLTIGMPRPSPSFALFWLYTGGAQAYLALRALRERRASSTSTLLAQSFVVGCVLMSSVELWMWAFGRIDPSELGGRPVWGATAAPDRPRQHRRRRSVMTATLATGAFPKETRIPMPTTQHVLWFEVLPSLDQVRLVLQTHFVPYVRFRSVPYVTATGNVEWEQDATFSLDYHIQTKQATTESDILRYIESLFRAASFGRGKPLWNVTLIRNADPRGKSAIVFNLALVVGDLSSFLAVAVGGLTDGKGQSLSPVHLSSVLKPLGSGTAPSLTQLLGHFPSYTAAHIRVLQKQLSPPDSSTLIKPPHESYIYSGSRELVICPSVDFEIVRQVRASLKEKLAAKVTVSELLVAAVSGAIRRYLVWRGDEVLKREGSRVRTRALLPFAYRHRPSSSESQETSTDPDTYSNRWSFISIHLPVGEPDALERVRLCRKELDLSRILPEAAAQTNVQNWTMGMVPEEIAGKTNLEGFTRHSLVLTNIPFHHPSLPSGPLFFAREPVITMQPVVSSPLPNVTIFTYAGLLNANFVVDPNEWKECGAMGGFWVEELSPGDHIQRWRWIWLRHARNERVESLDDLGGYAMEEPLAGLHAQTKQTSHELIGILNVFSNGFQWVITREVFAATSMSVDTHRDHVIHSSNYNDSFAEWAGENGEFIVAMVPGVNLSWREAVWYLSLVFIASVWHEAGHSIAAACESIHTHVLSIHFYVLYPAASVRLDDAALSLLNPLRRLRILTAGSWNNTLLAVLGYISASILGLVAATISGTVRGSEVTSVVGVEVLSVTRGTVLDGYVRPGDLLVKVDGHDLVGGARGWEDAVRLSLKSEDRGVLGKGWCVDSGTGLNDVSCCKVSAIHPLSPNSLQCFAPRVDVQDLINRMVNFTSSPELTPHERAERLEDILRFESVGKHGRCLDFGGVAGGVECTADLECGTTVGGRANADTRLVKRNKDEAVMDISQSIEVSKTSPLVDGRVEDYILEADKDSPESQTVDVPSTNQPLRPRVCLSAYIPHPHVRLLRLGVRPLSKANDAPVRELAVLGDPREAWESVVVDVVGASRNWGLQKVTEWLMGLLRDLSSISLALALFNLVPARHLDGASSDVPAAVVTVAVAVCSGVMGAAVVGGFVVAVLGN